jgi:hypothetical protein
MDLKGEPSRRVLIPSWIPPRSLEEQEQDSMRTRPLSLDADLQHFRPSAHDDSAHDDSAHDDSTQVPLPPSPANRH